MGNGYVGTITINILGMVQWFGIYIYNIYIIPSSILLESIATKTQTYVKKNKF